MVIFDVVQITDDAKSLIIKAHVSKAQYYKNVRIKKLFIHTEDTFTDESISNNNIYECEFDDVQEIDLNISCFSLDPCEEKVRYFINNLFFITVETNGLVDPQCTPCGMDKIHTTAITFNGRLLYNKALSYIKELSNTCEIPQGFINFILNMEALKVFIESDNYQEAIKLYKKLYKSGINTNSLSCGCHG